MVSKLVACVIIENDEDVFELSLKSYINHVDKVVIVNGNHTNEILYSRDIPCDKIVEIEHPYHHKSKGANGKQRNVYLDYLKKHHIGDWCLVVDADEVIENPEKIKKMLKIFEDNKLDSINTKMIHYINNLGLEDSTVETHYVQKRLFKVKKDSFYPLAEHVLPEPCVKTGTTEAFIFHHLGYCREIFRLKKKYDNHRAKSNIHSTSFLTDWYHKHLLGEYPVKKVDHEVIPKIIKEHFEIDDDYLYFRNRGVELKHVECVKQWSKHFNIRYFNTILDIGCGRGPYMRYWELIADIVGVEISEWCIKNKVCDSSMWHGSVTAKDFQVRKDNDLVTVIDILEHLSYEDLDKALVNIYGSGEKFLFSIPFIGDPNLEADKTHIIKESREWWMKKLEYIGFKISDVPGHFLFKEQLLEGSK